MYGVDIALTPLSLILLNSFGYATTDAVIPFTIAPAEYTATTAYMVIMKNGVAIEYIPVETHGQGTATIGRGFWFDINSRYEVELVLNYGTGVEIRSGKVGLAVAQVRIIEPANNTRFDITTVPAMPTVNASAVIVGLNPDPTATTTFEWTAQIRFQANSCPYGPNRQINLPDLVQPVIGGQFTSNFNTIRGGDLTLISRVTIGSQTGEDRTGGLKIRGTNPL